MQLSKTIDPRDSLQKARRPEMYRYAKANGITEINDENMPGDLMRAILRAKGITRIPCAAPTLGAMAKRPADMPAIALLPPNAQVVELDATEDLRRQYEAQQKARQAEAKAEKPVSEIIALRRECKARGIKFARTDKMADLKAKLAV